MSVTSSQANIIDELFVRTADENYMTARWCAITRLNTDFAWLSVHALEKYLKAALLYNSKPAKKQGHDIVVLYDEVELLAADLLPKNLTKPPRLGIAKWWDATPRQFLKRLYNNGNEHNRYQLFGYDVRDEDLHMLDTMVYAIRRLGVVLDDPILPAHRTPAHSCIPTHREVLLSDPSAGSHLRLPLDKIVSASSGDPLTFAALNLTFSFAPDDWDHQPVRSGDSLLNPVLDRRVFKPLASSHHDQVQEGLETAQWLRDNVRLPGDPNVAKQIADGISDAEHRLASLKRISALHRL